MHGRRHPVPQPTTAPSSAASARHAHADQGAARHGQVRPAGLTPTLDTVGVYFALDKGFFEEQGLKVEVTGYARATAIRAMLSGSADLIEIDSAAPSCRGSTALRSTSSTCRSRARST